MGVALCHPELAMPEESLNHIQRNALVHQKARERVTQVMEANVQQP
jgi:hypothetical protein